MDIQTFFNNLNNKQITAYTYNDLKDSAVFLVKKDLCHKENFNFSGVYILTDTENNEEVVYVGSAYVRTVHERLLQYTSSKDTGNILINDLIDFGLVNNINDAIEKIKKLKVYAFADKSLEYKMIDVAGISIANKAGKIKK